MASAQHLLKLSTEHHRSGSGSRMLHEEKEQELHNHLAETILALSLRKYPDPFNPHHHHHHHFPHPHPRPQDKNEEQSGRLEKCIISEIRDVVCPKA